MTIPREFLINRAKKAMEKAYAPYSGFQVGAALLTTDGKIYTGGNQENASYGGTLCAERVAFAGAVHAGERNFSAIAVVGGQKGRISGFCPPCGICRQILREFCTEDFLILLFDGVNHKTFTLSELLPFSFGPDHLEENHGNGGNFHEDV